MRDPARDVLARRPRHGLIPVALGLLGLCASLGCGAKSAPKSARVPITVAIAVERPVPFAIAATGTVEAIRTAAIGSQVGGTVQRVAFREGDYVRAGQLLIQLDPRPFGAALDQALAALARDRARAATARVESERAEKLFAQDMLSQSEWDQKRADAEALAATVQADSAAASTARLNLEFAAIRAPISGHTGRVAVHAGDYVKAATSDPLVTIIQPDPIRVRFAIPEREVPLLQRYRTGNPRVEIHPDGSRVIPGKLVFVDNAVDPGSGTLLLKGEVPNPDGRLVPGQFVDVRLILYVAPKSLVVPARAVSVGQQGSYVYVVKPDSTVASRPVEVERTRDEISVIARGLTAGEAVVTDGQLKLAPGSKVSIRPSIVEEGQ
ncbi:MAG: efflux RND transporter periplasmic adaptor subunit [Candidatus Eisenbacteria bacterium]|uniref:Efflux RND transporter periplasmic adaptor subunit n=1 Tax=Eiseniibacteriota bacterium TaxID=2212470 RepID=A0A538TJE0_UNCEI|nr:MAG: efflux RND transporter periplasmic adaptor subunit [Candidatus Eisenbacteria bacterium]